MTHRPERHLETANSLDIIRPYIERIASQPDVQILGGLGSAALASPGVTISLADKEVRVPESFNLSARRPDGTLRDVDVLVLSSDPHRIDEVESELKETVGSALKRSVFSIRPGGIVDEQIARPETFRVFRTFVSDRYDRGEGQLTKTLFPFSVPIHPETLETWSLLIGDKASIPIPHPGITIANYTNRSISGTRPKDFKKVAGIADNVFAKTPEMKEWLVDGPGASQLELSAILASLLEDRTLIERVLQDLPPIPVYSQEELASHDAYLPRDFATDEMNKRIIGRAVFKAEGLHFFEKYEQIVTGWQKYVEGFAGAIVNNK